MSSIDPDPGQACWDLDVTDFSTLECKTIAAGPERFGQKGLTAELGHWVNSQVEERRWLFPLEHRKTSEVRAR